MIDENGEALYAMRHVEDALGEGLRIHTSEDTVYELRHGDVDTRIYPGRGSWHVTVRLPAGGVEDAYETFSEVVERLDDVYDTDMDIPVKYFHEQLESPPVTQADGRRRLTYNPESRIDIPPHLARRVTSELPGFIGDSILAGGFLGMGGGVVGMLGGLVGGALLGSPELMLAGLGAGAGVGGTAGAGIAAYDMRGAVKDQYSEQELLRRKMSPDDSVPDRSLLEDVNEKRFYDAYLMEADAYDTGETARYDELKEQDPETLLNGVMDIVFEELSRVDGVVAEARTASYEDAYRFAATAADVETGAAERPSLFDDAEAFRHILSHTTYTADGDTRLLPVGEELVETLFSRDAIDPDIAAWLEEEHPAIVQRIGAERSLNRGGRKR